MRPQIHYKIDGDLFTVESKRFEVNPYARLWSGTLFIVGLTLAALPFVVVWVTHDHSFYALLAPSGLSMILAFIARYELRGRFTTREEALAAAHRFADEVERLNAICDELNKE